MQFIQLLHCCAFRWPGAREGSLKSTGIKAWKRKITWRGEKEVFCKPLKVLVSQCQIAGKDRQVNQIRKKRRGKDLKVKRRSCPAHLLQWLLNLPQKLPDMQEHIRKFHFPKNVYNAFVILSFEYRFPHSKSR